MCNAHNKNSKLMECTDEDERENERRSAKGSGMCVVSVTADKREVHGGAGEPGAQVDRAADGDGCAGRQRARSRGTQGRTDPPPVCAECCCGVLTSSGHVLCLFIIY